MNAMQWLSAASRREIIDWIVAGLSGGEMYGDERDVPPTDCELFFIHEWHGRNHAAKLRRANLETLSDGRLLSEAWKYQDHEKQIAALMPRKRGRPKGTGSFAQADEMLLDQVRRLMADGLSRHAATQMVACRAPGGGTPMSKARRLARRLDKISD
jgi:hypothetical protein